MSPELREKALCSFITSENRFVVPPLGGSVGHRSITWRQTLPPKGGATNYAFLCFKATQRDMNDSLFELAMAMRERAVTSVSTRGLPKPCENLLCASWRRRLSIKSSSKVTRPR